MVLQSTYLRYVEQYVVINWYTIAATGLLQVCTATLGYRLASAEVTGLQARCNLTCSQLLLLREIVSPQLIVIVSKLVNYL